MGVVTGTGLRTIPMVLEESQVIRLREIAADRSSAVNRVSVSSVCREMVESGLQSAGFGHTNRPDSSDSTDSECES